MAARKLHGPDAPPGDWIEVGVIRNRKSVILDANGNGSVQFDVRSSNNKYEIEDVLVESSQASTQTPYPTATAYLGGTQQIGLIEGATWTGNQDIMRGKATMDACTDLIIAFTGGVTGSVLTAVIEGKNYLWR